MAVIAIGAAGNVCCVLARCCAAVVTGAASTKYLCVIDSGYRRKSNRAVAVLTDVRCQHMNRALACGRRTVVAADTVINDANMIEYRRKPSGCNVAVVTLVAGRNVVRRFSCCLNIVVATDAASSQRRMIDVSDHAPTRSNVTAGTLARRRNMVGRFRRCAHEATLRMAVATRRV